MIYIKSNEHNIINNYNDKGGLLLRERGGEGRVKGSVGENKGEGGDEGKEWALPLFGSSLRPC